MSDTEPTNPDDEQPIPDLEDDNGEGEAVEPVEGDSET